MSKEHKTDAFINTALQKLDDEYGECEADIIDATGGSAVDMDSDATAETECSSGYRCLRVRMQINSTAEYNGDTDGEELAASCP